MKRGRMQCKDIPDAPVLAFLADLGAPASWFGNEFDSSVTHAMPAGTPEKLALAKMGMLMRRGLVDGCTCGCRGDFELTDKGRAVVATYGEVG
jgi:hypothetical protein